MKPNDFVKLLAHTLSDASLQIGGSAVNSVCHLKDQRLETQTRQSLKHQTVIPHRPVRYFTWSTDILRSWFFAPQIFWIDCYSILLTALEVLPFHSTRT